VVRTQRRQVPRMTVKGPAYVNLDPNNGGVILNISEGGLCFQSTAPILRTETIRFWFSFRSYRIEGLASKDETQTKGVSRLIEVGSDLAWTDRTRMTGGLRFTNLSAEAREQIRDWVRNASLVAVNEKVALSSQKSRSFSVKQSITNAARRASARLEVLFGHIRPRRLWTGFAGGLLAGVLVSALVVAVFSLLTRSRELGDTLIRLGERLGGKSWSQPLSPQPPASSQEPRSTSPYPVAPKSNTASPDPHPVVAESQNKSAERQTVAASSIQAPRPEKLASTVTLTATKSYRLERETASRTTPSLSAPSAKPSDTPALSSTASRPLSPGIGIAPAPDLSTGVLRSTAPEMELANRPDPHIESRKVEGNGMRSEKYLEVGKFKEKLLAEKTVSKFSHLGFPALVIQRNRFLGKSYQVLVGPYGDDREAEAAHRDLESLGFTPRSYERGRRDFTLPPALKVAGSHLPVGDCVISWESYSPDAIVKIEDVRGMGVTLEGKWVNQGVKYTEDAVGLHKNRDGSRTLIEIRFAGMGQALVFGSN
jgi:cell division protein FtsN